MGCIVRQRPNYFTNLITHQASKMETYFKLLLVGTHAAYRDSKTVDVALPFGKVCSIVQVKSDIYGLQFERACL